jgi:hypothetical protein
MPRRDADPELGHPDVAGWVLAALDPDEAERFAEHLRSCDDCQAAVGELEPVAQMLRSAAVDTADTAEVTLPASLQERTLARVRHAAGLAEADAGHAAPDGAHGLPDGAQSLPDGAHGLPEVAHAEPDAEAPGPGAEESEEAGPGAVTPVLTPRVAAWRRTSVRALTLAAAAVVAIAAGIAVWISRPGPAPLAFTIPLHAASGGAASGQATAQHAGNGWFIKLTVHGLKDLGSGRFYECWYAGPGNRPGHANLITAGTFTVDRGGSATVQMWSAADPRTFRTMQITAEQPGDAAQHGQVVLSGSARL